MKWLAIVIVVVVARVASAQPAADLTHEFQAGVDAFRLGHFDEARAHLEKARTIDPKLPGPHRFLAAVAQAQSRWQDCIDAAHEAIARSPLSAEAPETRKLHADCRVAAGRAPYRGPELGDSAAIAVTTNVVGATVKIGGLVYGGTPLAPRPITAGALEVEITKAGWKPAHVAITAPAGIVTDVIVDLDPDTNAGAEGELEIRPKQKPTVGWIVVPRPAGATIPIDGKLTTVPANGRIALAPGDHGIELDADGKDPWRHRVRVFAGQKTLVTPEFVDTSEREHAERLGLELLGGGGALLVGGFAAFLVSEHAMLEAREINRVETGRDPTQPLSVTGALEPVHTRAELDDANTRASRWAVVSDVAYGAGAITAGIAAYILYKHGREPPPFTVDPTAGGVVVSKAVAW